MEFYAIEGNQVAEVATCKKLFDDNWIVLPGVSYANVGQLAIDLIINTLLQQTPEKDVRIKRVGHLFSECVPPLAGISAYSTQNPRGLCLNLEVYQIPSEKITFVQQRAPVNSGKMQTFAQELADWFNSINVAGVIVLAGADDMLRHDQHLHGLSLTWITSPNAVLPRMEFLKSLPSSSGLLPTSEAITDLWKDIRGTGLSPLLHTQCHMKSIPFLSFVLYCAEGNNVPEAMKMASLVVQYLEMEKFLDTEEKYFVFPPSWKQLFGRAPDVSLYL